jgi:hypothetical protein
MSDRVRKAMKVMIYIRERIMSEKFRIFIKALTHERE